MSTGLRLRSLAFAVALLSPAVAPIASALLGGGEAIATCTCLVKMECCRKGLCHMDQEPAGRTLRWAGCSGARHEEKAPPMTSLMAVCEARFELAPPGRERTIFFEGVPRIARHSSDGPDHVPIFTF